MFFVTRHVTPVGVIYRASYKNGKFEAHTPKNCIIRNPIEALHALTITVLKFTLSEADVVEIDTLDESNLVEV